MLVDVSVVIASVLLAGLVMRPRPWHFGLRGAPPKFTAQIASLGALAFFLFSLLYAVIVHPNNPQRVVEDLGADGLKADRNENQPYDTYESAGKRVAFDGDYKKQKLTKEEYQKVYGNADDRYSHLLQALLAQLKQTS